MQHVILEIPISLIEVRAPWNQTGWPLYGANKAVHCCMSELAVQTSTLLGTYSLNLYVSEKQSLIRSLLLGAPIHWLMKVSIWLTPLNTV